MSDARDALARNDLPAAESKYRAALVEQPRDALAMHGLGKTLERRGRIPEALDLYKLLATDQPGWGSSLKSNAGFLTHYADLCEANGRLQDALEAYQRVLQSGLDRIGDWAPAVPRSADTVQRARSRATAMAGIYLAVKWQTASALQKFERAKQLDPNAPEPHFYIGYVLDRMGRYDEAKNAFAHARAASGGRPDIERGIQRVVRLKYSCYE